MLTKQPDISSLSCWFFYLLNCLIHIKIIFFAFNVKLVHQFFNLRHIKSGYLGIYFSGINL